MAGILQIRQASKELSIHSKNFVRMYGRIESPVPWIMAVVCAIPLHPPNAVKAMQSRYLVRSGQELSATAQIPLVISIPPVNRIRTSSGMS